MRKKLVVAAVVLAVLTGAFFFSPYNPILEMMERQTLKSFISSNNTFKGLEVVDVDYRGSDTYLIQTQDGDSEKNFVVMRYNTSVMNGHWKVFEEIAKENYY
ncbi:hypothetical protein [Halobacillus litoralis]|uniref:hypothetical protein n=1 Tax=Halobacillus litoralis TaxID=45668 RepID=UPI001CFE52B9|nr:hypothetical protein [Halobacillus litoralis]